MKEQLEELLQLLKTSWSQLSQRDRWVAIGAAAGVVFVIFLITAVSMVLAISKGEKRIATKLVQLQELQQLKSGYKEREQQNQNRIQQLRNSNVKLIQIVEDIARQAGVEIGRLEPGEDPPTAEGVVQSNVELLASGLSSDRLADFLKRLEEAPGLIVLRRMSIQRPSRGDTLDLKLTVTTYKMTAKS